MDKPFVVQMQPGNKWGVVCIGDAKLQWANCCLLKNFEDTDGTAKSKADRLAFALNQAYEASVF
jgi:hypothetical protein